MKVIVPSLAKLNLDLRVLHKRPDGYHELRTIFQTISLSDQLEIEFDSAERNRIELHSSIEIEDNIVARAAKLVLEQLQVKAHVRFSLRKRIPMGAGLGGGSSNAAAVLIALPALAGRLVSRSELLRLAETLGSDVAFFLYGGTALACGRGAELYPLPDQPPRQAVVVSTGVHVSTRDAYKALNRRGAGALTSPAESPILREFQTVAWAMGKVDLDRLPLRNDFEQAVFRRHPELARVARKLRSLGARPALMTGSGAAVFGIFADRPEASKAASGFASAAAFPVRFVGRRQYCKLYQRALGPAAAASCLDRPEGEWKNVRA